MASERKNRNRNKKPEDCLDEVGTDPEHDETITDKSQAKGKGTAVVLDLWEVSSNIASSFKGLFFDRVLCMQLFGELWEKEGCEKSFPFICEHDVEDSSTQTKTLPQDMSVASPQNLHGTSTKTMSVTSTQNMSGTATKNISGTPTQNISGTSTKIMSGTSTPDRSKTSTGVSTTKVRERMESVFVAIKAVAGYFNPRLIAKPDVKEKAEGLSECLRVCKAGEKCSLVNFFPPNHCAIYWDAGLALKLGAEQVTRWSVWVLQNKGG